MLTEPLSSFDAWVKYLSQVDIPVLRRTNEEMARLKAAEDEITGHDIARALLHDPLMTLKVLRFLQDRRRQSQHTDVTTTAHALMMVGTTPFFRHFADQASVEDRLHDEPLAQAGLMRVMSRAYHAAIYARDWATLRHDIEVDEICSAALLHDTAEMLLWFTAPRLAIAIRERQARDPALRSTEAQRQVLGFPLQELELALAREWKLPALLATLVDDRHANEPRTRTVMLAVSLARHSADGWGDAALPDDYKAIAELLHMSLADARPHMLRSTLFAAQGAAWYSWPPAARWLPLLDAP